MSRLDISFHPALTCDALEKLFKSKIYTALAFVQTDPEVITRISGVPYSKVLAIKNAILAKFSSPLVTGYALYTEVVGQDAIISSGIQGLDTLLDGGFMTGNIYEICGPAPSGKTQICMTVAVNVCHYLKDQTILYISTKNDLLGHRIFEIVENAIYGVADTGALMNKIKICNIGKVTELITFLHTLSNDLSTAEGKTLGFRLIIIDSLSSLFFRFTGDDHKEGLALLNNLANILHFISVEYHIAVLLTNLITSWTIESEVDEEQDATTQLIEKPALGKYWVHIPDTRINVKKLDNCDKCLLIISKSTSQPVGKTCEIKFTKGGVI